MTEPDPLDLTTRRTIYELIEKSPGMHFRAIQRRSDLPAGVVDYHLRYLVEQDMVVAKDDGHYKRYYILGTVGSKDKKLLGLLRQPIPRQIVMYLLLNPGAQHKNLKTVVDVSASTLSYHLKKLKKSGVVTATRRGRANEYTIEDEARVARALITYKQSFLDDAVDSFAKTWLEIHP